MKFSLFSFETKGRAAGSALQRTGKDMRPPIPTITPEHMQALRGLQQAERIIRSYDAAVVDGYNADFKGTYGSPNTEILPFKYPVRARTRTLAKDTPHGKAVVRTHQNAVVGEEPFKLEMKVGQKVKRKNLPKGHPAHPDTPTLQHPDTGIGGPVNRRDGEDTVFVEEKDTNSAIEEEWKQFIKRENFTTSGTWSFSEVMRMVEAEEITSGGVICREFRAFPFNKWRYAVRFYEDDRLDPTYVSVSDRDGMFGEGNPIRGSIEYHKVYTDRPVAYWILTRHPGEFFAPTIFGSRGARPSDMSNPQAYREQVPASDVIHFNNLRDRAEQDVGFTELDATTQPLWRMHQFEKALTLASIASAAKPWWIERDIPNGFQIPDELREQLTNTPGLSGLVPPSNSMLSDDGSLQNEEGAGKREVVVKPAAREQLPPGFKLKQGDPKFPLETAPEFRKDNLRDIAVGTGVAYQHVSGDFQNLGFIAGLMCMQPFHDHVKVRQHSHIDGRLERIFRSWLKSSILAGVWDDTPVADEMSITRLDEFCQAAHFKGKRHSFVNPLVEAQALILMCEAGHLTRQQVQDLLPHGMSFEKLVHALENEKQELEAHGLTLFDIDATRPTMAKGEPGQTVEAPGEAGNGGAAAPKTGNPVRSPRSNVQSRGRIGDMTLAELFHMSTNGD